MMKRRNATYILILLLSTLNFVPFRSAYAIENGNLAGAVVTVKNLSYIIRGDKKMNAKPGDSIYAHDAIEVGSDGAVKILLRDHTVIDLSASTKFKIDEYSHNNGSDRVVSASMSTGTVRSAVTETITGSGKFHLKTPSATMGVRGTEFVVQMGPKGSEVTVLKGQVDVAPKMTGPSSGGGGNTKRTAEAKPMVLGAGQQVVASANTALPAAPVTLDAAALNKTSSASKVSDNTFSKAVTIEPAANTNNSSSPSSGNQANARNPSSTGNGGGSGNSGNTTLGEISNSMANVAVAQSPVNTSQIGLAGSFSPIINTSPVTIKSSFSHINVIIHH